MPLRALPTEPELETSTTQLIEKFYVPALSCSLTYDRGVGYFTSGWLRMAASGLAALASNGGKARILASPKLDREDCAAISKGLDARTNLILRESLDLAVADLERELETSTLAALAWMLADGLLDFRIAVPSGELDGDFHDKFGIFYDEAGDGVAFHGSQNDSLRGFRNYEAISIFYSWVDHREELRVRGKQRRFNHLWENGDPNLRVYEMPDAVRRNILQYTERNPRPYGTKTALKAEDPRWRHQKEALAEFLKKKHGVLEMATGTGKTRTALMILDELITRDQVRTAIVVANGTDLLDQWHKEIVKRTTNLPIYRAYGTHHEAQSFINDAENSILLTSRLNLRGILPRLQPEAYRNGMIICDEAHGMGSPALVEELAGKLSPFTFRLGLSATPEREYDQAGNDFIEQELGPVFFRFDISTAIKRKILCPLTYIELEYEFSDQDKADVAAAIRKHHAKARDGVAQPKEVLYQEIARIKKLSRNKLPPFRDYLAASGAILHRCLIFVETAEYGLLVQDILMQHHVKFHTYYGDDDRENLTRFAKGELDCLITCHRISEGIDIRSVNNIVLFSSARARLETVQRVGRCLRVDPSNPMKRANVLDFIRTDDIEQKEDRDEMTADMERREWFRALSCVEPEEPKVAKPIEERSIEINT
ncbi:MAG: DEAD/DEAH box helicase family protein [Polaromonas sp.]|uniref:DEAD/DEAH box helicase family protein n=1 Tax=Polaromonas sp. TaxID=1869339 RepID=UPI002730961C|nr:DEAD/DEAH box helicase family protein [Polaromonas sp.]MDP2450750.1 DEAD/DEAH box helicase family protein [Polaromonas sp.]MDP3246255.1 DEAD/DEAH box helicase family protein [Polaromonas sp.]MDP3754901.1 DEAD/DEAH box helicase family protein [Polaromonas sp.]